MTIRMDIGDGLDRNCIEALRGLIGQGEERTPPGAAPDEGAADQAAASPRASE